MDPSEARELLRPAVVPAAGTWADLGAGRGTFTRALAALLGPGGVVYALDRDRSAVEALRAVVERSPTGRATIRPLEGDFRRLDAVPELADARLDGALFANALHFVAQPESVLRDVAERLRRDRPVVVVEYEGRSSSPWVPHPLPPDRLAGVAQRAGFGSPRIVGRHPSRYRGSMYCAVLERGEPAGGGEE